MPGREHRCGRAASALRRAPTTADSNGSVNAMHDSFTPLGGLVPMVMIQLGEVVYGGVGSGLYGMLAFVFVAVFVAGLMVGGTPEDLGKKNGGVRMERGGPLLPIPPLLLLLGPPPRGAAPPGPARVAHPRAAHVPRA